MEFLSETELAKRLKITSSEVNKLRRDGRIPSIEISKTKHVFCFDQVAKALTYAGDQHPAYVKPRTSSLKGGIPAINQCVWVPRVELSGIVVSPDSVESYPIAGIISLLYGDERGTMGQTPLVIRNGELAALADSEKVVASICISSAVGEVAARVREKMGWKEVAPKTPQKPVDIKVGDNVQFLPIVANPKHKQAGTDWSC